MRKSSKIQGVPKKNKKGGRIYVILFKKAQTKPSKKGQTAKMGLVENLLLVQEGCDLLT